MLIARILSALIGIPAIFVCVYFGGIPFFIMMFAVSFFCVQEYLSLTKKYKPHFLLSLILSSAVFILLYLSKGSAASASFSAVLVSAVLCAKEVFGKTTESCVQRIAVSFFGAFFLPFALAHLLFIRNSFSGASALGNSGAMKIIFFIFITVWVLDTAAYAFGKMLGKHKLAPNVSPKKTVEGAAAGVIFGVLTAGVCKCVFMNGVLSLKEALIFGFVISVVGQFSDLAESLIKRDANIKDSGNIIPGHGGFLDRFDSYIFAAPAVYYLLPYIK